MCEHTLIQFAHHTWSMWRGCSHASLTDGSDHPGCTHCYAETMSHRNPAVLGEWGPDSSRPLGTETYLTLPYKWDRAAQKAGERRRVFPSLMDPFEDRLDLTDFRHGLFRTIDACPHLDFLLFTKRPRLIREFWPGGYRKNVWLVYSSSDQTSLDDGVPHLLHCRDLAPVLGLSAEPLLGPINLQQYLVHCYECSMCCGWRHADRPSSEECNQCGNISSAFDEFCTCGAQDFSAICPNCGSHAVTDHPDTATLDWVIPGGESGPRARPCDVAWIRSLIRQCTEARVPIFVKQLGATPVHHEIVFDTDRGIDGQEFTHPLEYIKDTKGGSMTEWPLDLRIRQFPLP